MYDQELITQNLISTGGSGNATDAIGLMVANMGAMFGIIMAAMVVGLLIAYAIYAIILGKIFKKAGIKSSIAWIPIYNTWKFLEMGDQKGFWALFMLIGPLAMVTTVFTWIAMSHIGKKFGKEDWFLVVGILLAPIWFIMLAFGKCTWNGAPIASAADVPVTDAQPVPQTAFPSASDTISAPVMPEAEVPAATFTAPEPTEATMPTPEISAAQSAGIPEAPVADTMADSDTTQQV